MIIIGDCLEKMQELEADSIDAIVTDPPYGLSFMGKDWDHGVPGEEFWKQALRVAKPGAHLLAFGGTRTFHRLAVFIEDAGWEIRETISWVYGVGFPKSHNISKAIDKMIGAEREVIGRSNNKIHLENLGQAGYKEEWDITLPASVLAKQWDGWGTALKPAWEPIIMARKPFKGTVANNVLEHGTGGINIDGCRIGTETLVNKGMSSLGVMHNDNWVSKETKNVVSGRFPANFIHDGSEEVRALLGNSARFFYSAKASKRDRDEGLDGFEAHKMTRQGLAGEHKDPLHNNVHPTVKPTDLMRYLCRLVTPPNGTVLDPFCGSGSTGKAAVLEGFDFIGIELNEEYAKIADARISLAQQKKEQILL